MRRRESFAEASECLLFAVGRARARAASDAGAAPRVAALRDAIAGTDMAERPHARRLRHSALMIGANNCSPPAAEPSARGSQQLQSAFVFVKPHANTSSVRRLVETHLADAGVAITETGTVCGQDIGRRGLIDRHYYSIASKATLLQPAELNVPADAFEAAFGERWATVLSEGRVYNAQSACAALNVDGAELNARWEAAMARGDRVKLGGGFYCAKLVGQGVGALQGQDIYTFNAFFMVLREQFTARGASIVWYNVEFDSAVRASTNPLPQQCTCVGSTMNFAF